MKHGAAQLGNNNAYCQDNEISWFDWTLVEKHADVHRFVTLLNTRRTLRDIEPDGKRESLNQVLREATKAWHGIKLNQPDWSDQSHSSSAHAHAQSEEISFYLILNAYWEALEFELPQTAETPQTDGADGSIRRSTHRTISPNGGTRHRYRGAPIGPGPAPWSCFFVGGMWPILTLAVIESRFGIEKSPARCFIKVRLGCLPGLR